MPTQNARRHERRLGAALVEFALTAPILFLLVFAACDFARANMLLHTMDNAAYEGCRRGIVPGAEQADVLDSVTRILDTAWVRDADIDIEPSTIDATTPRVTVTISVPMNQNAWVTPFFVRGRTFSTTYTLARETFETVQVP